MKTAVGYCRLSKEENGYGLSVQRQAIEDYCSRRGLELVEVYLDNGASGRSTRKRPGLEDALTAKADAIVATRVDRLARSSLDFHRIVQRVRRGKGTILFTEQEALSLDKPEGKMMISILAGFAEYESDLIGARSRAALAVAKARGRKIGNPTLKPASPVVTKLILRLRGEGLSWRAIARELDRRRIKTTQGGRWSHRSVQLIAQRAG